MNKRTLTRLASLAVGVGALAAFVLFVGVGELERVLSQVDPFVIALLTAVQLLGLIFYASGWFVLIRATGHRLRFLTCQGIAFASIFASYTLPSGIFLEAMRVLLGSRESGMSIGEATATVVLHRILYVVGFLGTTATAMLALILTGDMSPTAIVELSILPTITVVILVALMYLSLKPKLTKPLLDRTLRLLGPLVRLVQKEARMDGKATLFTDEYYGGFRGMILAKRSVAVSFVTSLGDWSCSLLILWAILISLGASVSFWVIIISMAVGRMIQMTPIAVPGMLGIYEAAITTSLSLFGVPVALAASAALLMRIITFWLELPVTGLAAYHYGFKFLSARVASSR